MQRQGAGAVYLNVFHMDILEFLSTRVENAEESKRIKMLSLGVVYPDKYYELLQEGGIINLFSAYDASKEYGVPFSQIDITAEYDNMVANPNIRKKAIKVRDLDTQISKLQQESGYPYALNVDTANRTNPIAGKIVMSNLCSEILQVQTDSEVNARQEYTKLGKDISCNLGSINLPNFIRDAKNGMDVEKSIETMVRALSFISDTSNIEEVPTVQYGNKQSHAIGLGAMGLHELLATNQIMYGDEDSIQLVDYLFELLNYETLRASNTIARERKENFVGFENSKYADGSYFNEYVQEDTRVMSDKVKEVFEGIHLPTTEDWKQLKADIMADGLYNQNRMAIAPTGSISYVNETTASLQPIVSLIEGRQEQKVGKVYYPAPGLNNDTMKYYKTAYDIPMTDMIKIYAAAQKHIDQGMSMTLYMRSDIPAGMYPWKKNGGPMSTKDLTMLRMYAWKRGIKSIYYVRTYTSDDQQVGIDECESCSI